MFFLSSAPILPPMLKMSGPKYSAFKTTSLIKIGAAPAPSPSPSRLTKTCLIKKAAPTPLLAMQPTNSNSDLCGDAMKKRAFLSVDDETDLDLIATKLVSAGFSIYASPKTTKSLERLGIDVLLHDEYAKITSLSPNMFNRLDLADFDILVLNLDIRETRDAPLEIISAAFLLYAAMVYTKCLIISNVFEYKAIDAILEKATDPSMQKSNARQAAEHVFVKFRQSLLPAESTDIGFSEPKTAFFSVVDATEVEDLARKLLMQGFSLVATPKTAVLMQQLGIPVNPVEEFSKIQLCDNMFSSLKLDSYQVIVINLIDTVKVLNRDAYGVLGIAPLEFIPTLLLAHVLKNCTRSLIVTDRGQYSKVIDVISREDEEGAAAMRRELVKDALTHLYFSFVVKKRLV